MNNELFVQTRLEQELRRALADKTIQVHYQPQASLQDGHIFGVEALARWKHPRLGEVEPAVFFELAQTSGIAVAIDEYVQSRALADAAEWQSQGLEVAVSVNISPAQIKQESFVEDFQQRLEDANVDPAMVKVELVETALLEGADDILQNLQGIKAMGVELAIDDFGTGYSSLSYLQQFPIDWLKIDKTFLAEIKEGNNAVLVDAILAMGKGLGMKLIAEGVENAVQLNYLLENGCDAIQGFLISPAVAREQLPTVVAETKFSDLLADKQSHSDLAI
jgi:EAL domain-containing protein (putative c-di-GMP-specific phosphodiesterase class I)